MKRNFMQNLQKHRFLFEELVKRDFRKKYKRSVLGMGWSVLNPLLMLLVLWVVFSNLFGGRMPHFTTYLFCGNLMFGYFSEATREGMSVLRTNAAIFSKIDIPKSLFLIAKNVQVLINFTITLIVFFAFCAIDHIDFTWRMLLLVYPIITMTVFNFGMGYILSAAYVFYRDMQYLWTVALQLMMYGSAIFYPISIVPEKYRMLYVCNPVYEHIAYFREITIGGTVPSLKHHAILFGFAVVSLLIGLWVYRRNDKEFLYYV